MASNGGYRGSYNSGGGGWIALLLLLLLPRSSSSRPVMNGSVSDIFERIAAKASGLTHYNKRSTITMSGEIQTAVRPLLPGDLAKVPRRAHYNKRCTITSRKIQTAVRPLLPGELTKVSRLAHYNKKSTITSTEIQTAARQHSAAAAMPKGSGLTKLMKLSRPRRQATPYPRDVSFEYLSKRVVRKAYRQQNWRF